MGTSKHVTDESVQPPTLAALPRTSLLPAAAPIPLTRLYGRERERAHILELFDSGNARLVVLTGPGGIGKTRVALDVAGAITRRGTMPVAFVALAPIAAPELVLPTIARAIGVTERAGRATDDAMIALIGDRPLFMLIDNFEQVVTAAPVLTRLLGRCTGLRMLVTSRSRLDLTGEQCYPISPLPVPDESAAPEALAENPAVNVFVHAVRARRPEFALTPESAPPVVAICRQLEGWPLALELAGARSSALSVSALLSRLTPRLPLLSGGSRDGETRFSSMRDAIAWSAHLLDPIEHADIANLSVFRGGSDLSGAEAVLDRVDSDLGTLERIESLVSKSLLILDGGETAEPRYGMLETIREYATEQLEERGTAAAVRDRHATWCAELARTGGWHLKSSEAPIWIARLNANRDNLRAAMDWLERSGQIERFLDMASVLATFWDYQGELNEGRLGLERALGAVGEAHRPTVMLARAKAWLGWFQLRQGELDQAHATMVAALALWKAVDDVHGEAYAHAVLGMIGQIRGHFGEARADFENALRMFDSCGETPGSIEAMLNLSDLDYQEGDHASALDRATTALAMAEQADIRTYIAVSHVAVAQAKTALGNAEEALVSARAGLAIARELGFTVCAADAVLSVAATAASLGQLETSATLLGIAEHWLISTGSARFFFHHQFQRTVERVNQALGVKRYQRAYDAGAALSDADALYLIARISPDATAVDQPIRQLTARECEVLVLLAAGKSDREIASELFITYRTANAYVARVLDKLNVSSRTAAAALAIREGMV